MRAENVRTGKRAMGRGGRNAVLAFRVRGDRGRTVLRGDAASRAVYEPVESTDGVVSCKALIIESESGASGRVLPRNEWMRVRGVVRRRLRAKGKELAWSAGEFAAADRRIRFPRAAAHPLGDRARSVPATARCSAPRTMSIECP